MKRYAILLGSLAISFNLIASAGQSGHEPPLPATQRAHVLDGQFSIEKDVNQLPSELKLEFARLSGDKIFKMANPGEEYQSTDVIDRPGLPWRRLLFAGASEDNIFVLYEKGGRAHSYHVAVFHFGAEKKAKLLWFGTGLSGAASLEQLRTMVATGKFNDDQPYYW